MSLSTADGEASGAVASQSRLLVWFSPAMPTGAFGFSHGLEWAVEMGDVTDRETLAAWLADLVRHGGGWNDAVLAAAAYRAARGDAQPVDSLVELVELATALQPSAERRLESGVQGDAFLRSAQTGWPDESLARLRAGSDDAIPLPVAVGVAAAGAGLDLTAMLTAFLTGFCANLVSAALRLAPIGQSDGLRVLAALEPLVAETASKAAATTLNDLGGCSLRADIASMRHETQVTRLFRS